MTVNLPPAPKLPIFVVLRRWANALVIIDEDTPIEDIVSESGPDWIEVPESDSSISTWNYHAPFALLPYIDLPYEVLDKRGMGVLTADGKRGWVIWDMATCPLSSEQVEPFECPDFMRLLEEGNWEVIPIEPKEVDMEKHLSKRGDDGAFDLTGSTLWHGDSCEWCGHPMTESNKDEPCESCGAIGTPTTAGVIKYKEGQSLSSDQAEEWA